MEFVEQKRKTTFFFILSICYHDGFYLRFHSNYLCMQMTVIHVTKILSFQIQISLTFQIGFCLIWKCSFNLNDTFIHFYFVYLDKDQFCFFCVISKISCMIKENENTWSEWLLVCSKWHWVQKMLFHNKNTMFFFISLSLSI